MCERIERRGGRAAQRGYHIYDKIERKYKKKEGAHAQESVLVEGKLNFLTCEV